MRTISISLYLICFCLLGASCAQSGQEVASKSQHREHRAGYQIKRRHLPPPETVVGKILLVSPQEHSVAVAVTDSRLTSDKIIITHTTVRHEGRVTSEGTDVKVLKVPGEVVFNFKVNGSTSVRIKGRAATAPELASMINKPTTVRFIYGPTGDVALEIQVSR
jgi:hypothetical protein